MKHSVLLWTLLLALLLSACGGSGSLPAPDNAPSAAPSADVSSAPAELDPDALFSNRDFRTDYDESSCARIRLSGSSAACDSDAVEIRGTTVTITDEGTYVLSGTLDNGMIVVSADKADKVQLVLDNVTIHSEASAALYILQADKVFLTLPEHTESSLSNGGSFLAIDENNIDAVIFSKEDLTINGSGTLTVSSPAGHAIVSKDELTITGGTFDLTAASHAVAGKDGVCIANASMTITAGKDGIHAEHDEDTSLGYLYIQDGVFDIQAKGDGLSAGSTLQIDGGTFYILSGGGSENGAQHTSDDWSRPGNGMGGMGGMGGPGGMRVPGDPGDSGSMSDPGSTADPGHPEEPPGGMGSLDHMGSRPDASPSSGITAMEENSTSTKGIKAAANLILRGGTFTLDCADDALHSNGVITLSGGTYDIRTGDDGIHADDTLTVHGGTISIAQCYEGLEALHLYISGGVITLTAEDDGLNAAGGNDGSGTGGRPGGDRFGSSSNGSILISGGELHITASGDGIDANGTLEITGGSTTITGPTVGDTATLDYDVSASITGGIFLGTGSASMAQSFTSSAQGVLAVSMSNQSAGTRITVTDAAGTVLLTHTPELDFAVFIFSTPELVKGESYTITVGSVSGTFEAS